MAIGEIDNIAIGQIFVDRRTLSQAGVHRATQAGITGRADDGAESIVLSGGYIDDEDHGDVIIYTGWGGRDPNSGRQIADQAFIKWNQALVTNCLEGLPVRVTRGSGHKSMYSPKKGYQYAGLFWVDDYWQETGKDGYLVCRFRLVSSAEQRGSVPRKSEGEGNGAPRRAESKILRIVRDSALGKKVKQLYEYKCQVCGTKLECAGGPYAEAAHIRPLGAPHDGPDVIENIICLCPNHHVLFDHGGFSIKDDMQLVGIEGRLTVKRDHTLDVECFQYHRGLFKYSS